MVENVTCKTSKNCHFITGVEYGGKCSFKLNPNDKYLLIFKKIYDAKWEVKFDFKPTITKIQTRYLAIKRSVLLKNHIEEIQVNGDSKITNAKKKENINNKNNEDRYDYNATFNQRQVQNNSLIYVDKYDTTNKLLKYNNNITTGTKITYPMNKSLSSASKHDIILNNSKSPPILKNYRENRSKSPNSID